LTRNPTYIDQQQQPAYRDQQSTYRELQPTYREQQNFHPHDGYGVSVHEAQHGMDGVRAPELELVREFSGNDGIPPETTLDPKSDNFQSLFSMREEISQVGTREEVSTTYTLNRVVTREEDTRSPRHQSPSQETAKTHSHTHHDTSGTRRKHAANRSQSAEPTATNDFMTIKGKPMKAKKNDGFFSFLKSSPKPKVSPTNNNKKTAKISTSKHGRHPTKHTATKRREQTPEPPSKPVRKERRSSRSVTSDDDTNTSTENRLVVSNKGTRGPKKKSGPAIDDIPIISNWERTADGCITGTISNARNHEDGMVITTAPVTGRIVITDTGHKYRLI